ncbi:MAG: EutN/CcmL family microcompartment protein [Planctomycetota bacterium]|nr:EutN/CcmL family microcompartment protein [Planctomycetota bacterium]
MYLARVTGRLVATQRYEPGLEGVRFQWIQPLDEAGQPMGAQLVAAVALDVGPGDFVHFIDGREAALALPDETYVPIDVAVTGFVEQAAVNGRDLAKED